MDGARLWRGCGKPDQPRQAREAPRPRRSTRYLNDRRAPRQLAHARDGNTLDSGIDIYVVDATGGSPVNLTRNPAGQAGSADPAWSPDGSKILFLDNRVVNGVGRTGLATMNPDGSDRHFISNRNLEAHQADWQSIR